MYIKARIRNCLAKELYKALIADMDKQENTDEQLEAVPVAAGAEHELVSRFFRQYPRTD